MDLFGHLRVWTSSFLSAAWICSMLTRVGYARRMDCAAGSSREKSYYAVWFFVDFPWSFLLTRILTTNERKLWFLCSRKQRPSRLHIQANIGHPPGGFQFPMYSDVKSNPIPRAMDVLSWWLKRDLTNRGDVNLKSPIFNQTSEQYVYFTFNSNCQSKCLLLSSFLVPVSSAERS
jgi:hypothetical protein